MNRALTVATLALALGSCQAVGGGAFHMESSIGSAAVGGGVRPGSSCGDFHAVPRMHFAARLESTYIHNDPIPTATDFGSLAQNLTQAVGTSRPTFRAPCESGIMNNRPCFSHDGGDSLERAVVEAAYTFLHNGTGSSCLLVAETNGTGQTSLLSTGSTGGVGPGFNVWLNATQAFLMIQASGSISYGAGVGSIPTAQATALFVAFQDGAGNDAHIYSQDFTTVLGTGAGPAPPGSGNSLYPFRVGGNWIGGSYLNGEIYEIACFTDSPNTADREADQEVLECLYGAFPQ